MKKICVYKYTQLSVLISYETKKNDRPNMFQTAGMLWKIESLIHVPIEQRQCDEEETVPESSFIPAETSSIMQCYSFIKLGAGGFRGEDCFSMGRWKNPHRRKRRDITAGKPK